MKQRETSRKKKIGVSFYRDQRLLLGGGGARISYVLARCRLCGCTEMDCLQCIERTGSPCAWADADKTVCTACVISWHEALKGFAIIRGMRLRRSRECIRVMLAILAASRAHLEDFIAHLRRAKRKGLLK